MFNFALLTSSCWHGRGPVPAGMRMVPMVLPDGCLGCIL
jgi:hypothetical protein